MMYAIMFTILMLGGPDKGVSEKYEVSFDTRVACKEFEAALMQQFIDYQYATRVDITGCKAFAANEEIA